MKRWILTILGSLITLIVLSVVFIDVILEGLIEKRLQSAIQLQQNRFYDYSYDRLETKLLSGSLTIYGLKVTPRKAFLDSLARTGNLNKDIYEVELEQFRLEGLQNWKLLLNNEIRIGSIHFEKPNLKIYSRKKGRAGSATSSIAKDIIAPTVILARIDSLHLDKARFEYHHVSEDTNLALSFDSLEYSLYDFQVDSHLIKTGMYFEYDRMKLEVKDIILHNLPNLDVSLKNLYFRPDNRQLQLYEVRIEPKLDKFAYMKTQEYETDWISMRLGKLDLIGANFDKLHELGVLEVEEVEIDDPVIEVYRDKRMPDRPYQFVPLPSRIIRELPFPFHVDKVNVKNASITYLEWIEKASEPAALRMDRVDMSIANVSSDSSALLQDDTMKLMAKGRLMNSGMISTELTVPLLDTTDIFFSKGRIEGIEFSSMNPLIEQQAFVHFQEGRLNYLEYDMVADNERSSGRLDIDYEGLKKIQFMRNEEEMVKQVEKKKEGRAHKEKKMLSFLANTYLRNSYHPGMTDYYHGRIKFERDQGKAIFNYLVKSLMTGISSSVLPNFEDDWSEIKKRHQEELKARKKAKKAERHQRKVEK